MRAHAADGTPRTLKDEMKQKQPKKPKKPEAPPSKWLPKQEAVYNFYQDEKIQIFVAVRALALLALSPPALPLLAARQGSVIPHSTRGPPLAGPDHRRSTVRARPARMAAGAYCRELHFQYRGEGIRPIS